MLQKDEILELLERLKSVKGGLLEIRGYLDSYRKGENPFPDNPLPDHGVIHISPHIKPLFDRAMGTAMPYPTMIGLFEMWTLELMGSVIANRHHLVKKNRPLLKHYEEIYGMCMKFTAVEAGLITMLNRVPPPPTRAA
jgi:hypothetical protein